ncbi:toll-like protein receptor 13-like protein [Trifolium pratense]|uniref:Toll-like protein receptor 13-like protein n=1 Tax=Trifolium pratense TaxID=57577 RepID=A0A2K3NLY2_TRIPR|nr:toll-like protein receptor 13-like protein [Trifolium pratense]
MNRETELVELCINAACKNRETVEKWRLQKRSLDRLPSHLADALLRRLITRRLLHPSLLEVFKHSAEEVDVKGDNSVDAEWMAYLGGFRHLRYLNIAECHRINSSALWPLTGMNSLKELDLSRCSKVNDAGINHILSVPNLEKLHISKTSVTAKGVKLLASLKNLSLLDLGGLPVDDASLASLQLSSDTQLGLRQTFLELLDSLLDFTDCLLVGYCVVFLERVFVVDCMVLKNLQHIELWGSKISNNGAAVLNTFPKLTHLNLEWTSVTKLPNLSSLECLNMSNCTIDSILEDDKAPLTKLIFSGSTFLNEAGTLLYANTNNLSFLDLAHTGLDKFFFLSKMKVIEHLNLSSCMMDDDSVEMVACIGGKLKSLNLSGTWVSSAGVGILAGHVPNLEILSLSQTSVEDTALAFISLMPSLKVVDLSNTNIKGFLHQGGTDLDSLSLTALQNLKQLERLDLEHTQVTDEALFPLSSFQELRYLSLKSPSLSDISLYHLSSVPKLTKLGICDAVLTNCSLDKVKAPENLKLMDLRGCWLLTKDAILSFSRNHPQIEVRHELVTVLPFEENGRQHSSPSRLTSRTMQAARKKEQTSLSPYFVDQRMKYSRDELLALQFMSLPLASNSERDNSTLEKQLDSM